MATFTGTSGDDTLTGTSSADTFDLRQGGNDTAAGLGGNDVFVFGGTFTAADSIDGGDGTDVLRLDGDYSAGVVFTASTMTNVETIQVNAGNDYKLTLLDANVAPTATLTVTASTLGAGDILSLDASALVSGGAIAVTGGGGNDVILGGAGNDRFAMSGGGNDTVRAGAGDDVINMGGTLTHSDRIDGGAGNDTLSLNGDYSATDNLNNTTITGIETVKLGAGHDYNLSFADGNVAPNHSMPVDGSMLGAGDSMTIDIRQEQDGHYTVLCGAGDDTVLGGGPFTMPDLVDFREGGNDTYVAEGDTTLLFGNTFNANDRVTGASSAQVIIDLSGDYGGANAITLNNSTLFGQGLQIHLEAGNSYHITLGTMANAFAVVSNIGAADTAYVDASAMTGEMGFFGGQGSDTFIGGSNGDIFSDNGGTETFKGGGGSDIFQMGRNFTAADSIDGGAGADTVQVTFSQFVNFTATTMTNVETLQFLGNGDREGAPFDYVTNDATVAAGATLTVDASKLADDGRVTFDGSAETDGHFAFICRAGESGTDTYTGGALSDSFELKYQIIAIATGGGGADTFDAAKRISAHSYDTFVYNAVSDSTGTAHDTIMNMNFTSDFLKVSPIGTVTGIDAAVASGALSTASFDSDLAAAVGTGQLAAHHAVLFTANAGTLSGHTILVVDENGAAGYQSGGDLVIDVTGAVGTLTTSGFI